MQPERRHYAVLFGASMGLLMLELSFARTLSVALLSHYAFVAISLAMFGLGLAGLLVYLRPARFRPASTTRAAHDESLIPWAWGLNGATSVVASVSAVFVGAQAGFTWALLLGSATYALGFLVLTLAVSARRIAAPEQMRFAGER